MNATPRLRLEVLVGPGCPHGDTALERTARVAGRLLQDAEAERVVVRTEDEARDREFPGSPTVRVDSEDVELDPPEAPRLACRLYDGAGAPPEWLIEAGILRALAPRHLLFLCVANSARSQIAEGLARELTPGGVRISSAGSDPAALPREEALRVLSEIGVDARGQRSTGMDEVEGPVDAVITLCAEEVCPAWLGDAVRLHWPFPDPAAEEGDAAERLEAFRRVRDELRRRLRHLFPSR